MNMPTHIEQALFDYLPRNRQEEIQAFLSSLEDDPPTECPNCQGSIADSASFCDERCQGEFMDEERTANAERRISA